MNKYEYDIQVSETIIVEAENAEEGRMKLVNDEIDNISVGRPDACISGGRLVE